MAKGSSLAPAALPPLPPGWKYQELEELIESDGLSYGVVQPGANDLAGVPIVRVKNLRQGKIATDEVMRISPGIEEKYRRTRLRGGEVLLSLVGSVGEVAVVPPNLAGWNVARAVAVIRVTNDVSSSWMRRCLSAELAQRCMETWQTDTVQATLNLRDVRRLPIIMPPGPQREAITAVLDALDAK
jgi:type I restriction enzyme S subunit